MFYVYLIRNLINGNLYVGKTNNVNRRWKTHRTIARKGKETYPRAYSYIHAAISKYGEHNFEITMLTSSPKEEDIFSMEKQFIHQFKTDGYKLYNLTGGGDGASGLKHSSENRLWYSTRQRGNKNHWFGRKHLEETKKEISILGSGERNSNSKLTWVKVNQIRKMFSTGSSYIELSQTFGVAYNTIRDVCLCKTWKNTRT